MSKLKHLTTLGQNMILTAPVYEAEAELQCRKAHTVANILACAAIPVCTAMMVFADDPDPSTALKNLQQIVFFIFKAIGFIVSAWGLGQLIIAFKDEDANGKQKATMLMIAGILLFSVEKIFSTIGVTAPSLNLGNSTNS